MTTRSFPVIWSRSVSRAQQFYARLGFEETYRRPSEGEPGYVSLRRGDSELGIVSTDWPRDELGIETGGAPRFELYVYVDNVDATMAQFQDALLKEAQDMPWGERVGYLRDPDGNPVVLAAMTRTPAR
jgi:lactoylglutathione lyase